jgi:hypothetical protein
MHTQWKDRLVMSPIRTHLMGVAAALCAIAIAAPVSTAGAATAPSASGSAATVVAPTYVVTTPSSFNNTNIQIG